MARDVGTIFASYCVVRAVAEPFVIGLSVPVTHQADRGGPSLAGVLLLYCGPGVVAAVLRGFALRRWRRARRVVDAG